MSPPTTSAPTSTSLPLWIAAACVVAGVCLFFGNTVPALREREELVSVEAEFARLRRLYELCIDEAYRSGAGTEAADIDLQSLFVAIDEMGYTVTEFCESFPVEDGPATGADDPLTASGRRQR